MSGDVDFKTCMTYEQVILVGVLWKEAKEDLLWRAAKEAENNA